jgi:CBS domain-containing protein
MRTELVTATPETSTLEAIETMRSRRVACLPVVRDGRLVGIVTEHDFMDATAVLLDRWLRTE